MENGEWRIFSLKEEDTAVGRHQRKNVIENTAEQKVGYKKADQLSLRLKNGLLYPLKNPVIRC